jgi:hypothetical protein
MIRLESPVAMDAVAEILSSFHRSNLLEPAHHPEDSKMNRVKKTITTILKKKKEDYHSITHY